MYINLQIQSHQIEKLTNIQTQGIELPILTIDRDSYIVGARVETGLNFHPDDGCYSLRIGKYCSLAEDILFLIDINHDYKRIAQGSVRELDGIDIDTSVSLRRRGVLILNDVWIGNGVTILDGITIHNGAVVAAESVVTKDVPPYSIVAGNPAHVVGYRFTERQIKALKTIRWWNWSPLIIRRRRMDFAGNIDEFIAKYLSKAMNDKRTASCHNPVSDICQEKVYFFQTDLECMQPLVAHVIGDFCRHYTNGEAQLVLFVPNDGRNPQNVKQDTERIMVYLGKYSDTNAVV